MPSNTCCGVEAERSVEAALTVPRQIAIATVALVSDKHVLIGFTTLGLKRKIVSAMKNGRHLRMTNEVRNVRISTGRLSFLRHSTFACRAVAQRRRVLRHSCFIVQFASGERPPR